MMIETGELLDCTDFERLIWLRDRSSGMRAVVAIHDRTLGPPRGGTRLKAYTNPADAAADALRLAAAMTFKFALHQLPWGGAKAVLLGDEGWGDPELRRRRLWAYGRALSELGVDFRTGPDLGIGEPELAVLREASDRVEGATPHDDASAGTAAGVLACLEEALGDLAGAKVAVQGVGATGGSLARQLAERGAQLLLADVDEARARALAEETGGKVVAIERILLADVDALAPCATGGVFGPELIPELRCRVIAGTANAVLTDPAPDTARLLAERGILYVPDALANGGGAVAITQPQPSPRETVAHAREHVRATYQRVQARARERESDLWHAAWELAHERLRSVAPTQDPC
ncbi:MAG: Glu/Leu/Phe/Val dehydrogenase [Planctomycetes bacterium]|nr:Glu/Leu/Phe/Val dehydrogenase [Planctomycetota bacterium]